MCALPLLSCFSLFLSFHCDSRHLLCSLSPQTQKRVPLSSLIHPPRLFSTLFFLCPAFSLFFLVNCVFHWGTSPPRCSFFFSPLLGASLLALPSSLSSSSGQWRTGFIALITPQRSFLLLRLSSSYLLTTAVPSFPHSRSSLSSVSPLWLLLFFFFAHLLYIRIILHVLSSKRLVPPLLITPWPSLPAHSAGPSVPTLPLTFLLKKKRKKRKGCILAARCPWQKYTSILFRSWGFKCFIGKC